MGLDYALQIMRAKKATGTGSVGLQRAETSSGDVLPMAAAPAPELPAEAPIAEPEPPQQTQLPHPSVRQESSAVQSVKQPSPPRSVRTQIGRQQRSVSSAALSRAPSGEGDSPGPAYALIPQSGPGPVAPMLQQLAAPGVCPDPLLPPQPSHPPHPLRPAPSVPPQFGRNSTGTTSTRRRQPDHQAQRFALGGHVSPGGGPGAGSGGGGGPSVQALQLPRVPSQRSRPPQAISPRGGGTEPGAVQGRSASGGQEDVATAPGAIGGGGGGGGAATGGTLPAVRPLGSVRSSRLSCASLRALNDGSGGCPAGEGLRGSLRALLAEVEAEADGGGGAFSPPSRSRSGSLRRELSSGLIASCGARRRTAQGFHGGRSVSSSLESLQPPSPLSLPALLPVAGHGGGAPAISGGRSRAHSPAPPSSPKRRASRGLAPAEPFGPSAHLHPPMTGAGGAANGGGISASAVAAWSGHSGRGSPGEDGEEDGDMEQWAAELAMLEQWAASTQLDPAVVEATVEQHRALRRLAQLRARLLRARASAGSPVGGGAGGAAAAYNAGSNGANGETCTGSGAAGALPSWVGVRATSGDGDTASAAFGGGAGGSGGGGGGPTDSLVALASAVTRLPHVDYEAMKDPQYRMALKARYKHSRDACNATAEALREMAGQERQRTVWRSG